MGDESNVLLFLSTRIIQRSSLGSVSLSHTLNFGSGRVSRIDQTINGRGKTFKRHTQGTKIDGLPNDNDLRLSGLLGRVKHLGKVPTIFFLPIRILGQCGSEGKKLQQLGTKEEGESQQAFSKNSGVTVAVSELALEFYHIVGHPV